MRAFTYILECADGTLYTGYTTDMEKRLSTHNSGKASKYTRARLPVKLVYLEECKDKETAMSREWHIKQLSRAEKLKLIEENKVK
ncbi:putative endonuclease [Anaerovibrio lipolyticus DSM 3074]|uniref:Putative endonuclease n=1 Tax=Anaerovibrio lipolyticus DSM 3074 TaxID=1120997 RepID=A0A1M6EPB9_9FIRM|nr:GIY-YIG nuclease family protein [Anaerovibrio lipolyticus]SHI87198.1 putative endonuclease [Anaerovibrio lipolyticus DSM 3074]